MKNAGALEQSRLPALPGAGDERIELPPKVLETPIIPFDQSPVLKMYLQNCTHYIRLFIFCQ